MRRMRAAAMVVVLLGWAVFGAAGPAGADGSSGGGSSDPGSGSIAAGVYVYWGRWSGRHSSCVWTPYTGDTAVDDRLSHDPVTKVVGGDRYTLFTQTCPGALERLVWIGPGTPRVLVGDARDALARRLPRPEPATAPDAVSVFVTVPMWFWTATAWADESVTAWVPTPTGGTVWATTTATPARLRLDPGDGSPVVECAGPGEPWTEGFGDEATSECSHVFQHSSLMAPDGAAFRGSLSIEWDVSWTSSTGGGGPLEPLVTSSPVTFQVGEIQAVVNG